MNFSRYMTPDEAAIVLGCTPGRARHFTQPTNPSYLGEKAVLRFGRQAMILRRAVEKLAAKPRKAGRPRKFSPAKTSGKQAISGNPAK